MNNYKEYLDPDNGYVLIQQTPNIPFYERWIEVPEGAEYFIRMRTGLKVGFEFFFKYINGEFMLYRDSDWLSASYDCAQDYVDEGNEVLWSRKVNQEQGLISGADALRALADGEEVEYSHGEENCVRWTTIRSFEEYSLDVFLGIGTRFKFRLKPRTVKLEIEVPAPFDPKEGDSFWILSTNYDCGYIEIFVYRNDEQGKRLSQFGTWRTEAEIKIVVEQLRKLKEHSK